MKITQLIQFVTNYTNNTICNFILVKSKYTIQPIYLIISKVKQYSESTAKDTDKLQEELAKKSDLIRELEQHVKDSRIKFDELQKNLKKINEEKDSMEKKLSDDLESQKVNAERLQQELVTKGHDVTRLGKKT